VIGFDPGIMHTLTESISIYVEIFIGRVCAEYEQMSGLVQEKQPCSIWAWSLSD